MVSAARVSLRNKLLIIAAVIAVALCATAPAAQPPRARDSRQPLTFENLTRFFREALGRAPVKVDKRCVVFAEGEWKNANIYNHSLIMLENEDEDIEVTFVMTGDEGMNWVNEFFDSPSSRGPKPRDYFKCSATRMGRNEQLSAVLLLS